MNTKNAVDLAGRVAELVKKGATLEAQERIVELRALLIDLSEENLSLRAQLVSLRDEREKRDSLRYDESEQSYFLKGGKDEGPYCQPCWDSNQKLVRLATARGQSFRWRCNVCNQVFGRN